MSWSNWQNEGKLAGIKPVEPIKLGDMYPCDGCGKRIPPDMVHRLEREFLCKLCHDDALLAKKISAERSRA